MIAPFDLILHTLGVGALLVGIPLALKWIPPNRWYGFRTPATLSSPEKWYAGNRIAGIDLIVAGAVNLGLGFFMQNYYENGLEGLSADIGQLLIAGLVVGAAMGHAYWAVRQL